MKFCYILRKFFGDDGSFCFLSLYRIAKLRAFGDFVGKASGEIGEPVLHTKIKHSGKLFLNKAFRFSLAVPVAFWLTNLSLRSSLAILFSVFSNR